MDPALTAISAEAASRKSGIRGRERLLEARVERVVVPIVVGEGWDEVQSAMVVAEMRVRDCRENH